MKLTGERGEMGSAAPDSRGVAAEVLRALEKAVAAMAQRGAAPSDDEWRPEVVNMATASG